MSFVLKKNYYNNKGNLVKEEYIYTFQNIDDLKARIDWNKHNLCKGESYVCYWVDNKGEYHWEWEVKGNAKRRDRKKRIN